MFDKSQANFFNTKTEIHDQSTMKTIFSKLMLKDAGSYVVRAVRVCALYAVVPVIVSYSQQCDGWMFKRDVN